MRSLNINFVFIPTFKPYSQQMRRISHFVALFLFAFNIAYADGACPKLRRGTIIDVPKKYFAIMNCKELRGKLKVQKLVGRVLKGKVDSDFDTLSNDPTRKIIFLMGEDGLEELVGLDHDQILVKIGYTADYIARLKSEGYRFKLVVFKSKGDDGRPATWDSVAALTEKLYPNVASKIKKALPALKKASFSELETEAGFKFSEVDKIGKSDSRYVDEERLKKTQGKSWEVRAFFFDRVRLMDLYAGDGYTHTSDGKKALKEYIAPNKKLLLLLESAVIDL